MSTAAASASTDKTKRDRADRVTTVPRLVGVCPVCEDQIAATVTLATRIVGEAYLDDDGAVVAPKVEAVPVAAAVAAHRCATSKTS